MTKKELKRKAEEKGDKWIKWAIDNKSLTYWNSYVEGYLASAEPREKRIADLEKKISILLSCKNCPNNKGGYICQKEYEDKCLSQKIQYIKELQEENKELKKSVNNWLKYEKETQYHKSIIKDLKKENAELQQKWLDESYEKAKCIKSLDDKNKEINYLSEQIQELKIELDTPESVVLDKLDEAKEIIKELYEGLDKLYLSGLSDKQIAFIEQMQDKAEQFLGEL